MKLRQAPLWIVALIAASAACKSKQDKPPAQSVTEPGKAGSSAALPAPIASDAAAVAVADAAADPWSKPAAVKDPLPKPLFWSIEKAGTTSYLLGTMHIGIDAETKLPDIVWKKLDEAKAFAMEADLSDGTLAMKMAQRTDGKTLHDDLGPAYYAKLEQAVTPQVARVLDPMKPMVAVIKLSLIGLPETPPMDGVLHAHAQNAGKPVAFLEDAGHDAALLDKWMDKRALQEMLDDLELTAKRSQEMVAAYLAGDADKMVELSMVGREDFKRHGRNPKDYDEQMNDLLYKRNAAWIDRIEKLHRDGGAFIAVGALHLVGKKSVLDLLAQRGYKVTRITP